MRTLGVRTLTNKSSLTQWAPTAIALALTLALSLCVFSSTLHATVYPQLRNQNTRLLPLHNQFELADALVQAIDAATPNTPIDIVYYLITANPKTSLPVVNALRRAANRNVPIRVLTTNISTFYIDRSGLVARLLSDTSLATPIEFIEFGGITTSLALGLNISDAIHEKAVIIGNEIAFFGSGNLDGQTDFLDLSFAVKAVNSGTSSLVSQLQQMFEDRFNIAKKVTKPRKSKPLSARRLAAINQYTQVELDPQSFQYSYLVRDFLLESVHSGSVPGELRPANVQLITNDFLEYALLNIFPRTMRGRSRMPDDIEEAVISIVNNAKEIDLAAMILSLSPNVQAAIKHNLTTDGIQRIYTNSLHSASNFVPLGISYLESLVHILDLLTEQGNGDRLSIATMQPDDIYKFMHLKLLRTEDTVVLGSTNFNIQSTARNSELAVIIRDVNFSNAMADYVRNTLGPRFKPLSCEMALLHYSQQRTFIKRLVNAFLRVFY